MALQFASVMNLIRDRVPTRVMMVVMKLEKLFPEVVNQVTRKDMLTSEERSHKRAVEGTTKETRPW